jgi:hypothetical protein
MNTTRWHHWRKPRQRPRPERCRPQLEPLENRCLLSVTLLPQTRVNTDHLDGNQDEPTIAVDPTNLNRLFVAARNTGNVVASNNNPGPIYASYSSDGGKTWKSRTIGTGTGLGGDGLPTSYGDPQAVFDQFGNLFLTYLGTVPVGDFRQFTIELLVSTDGGRTFTAQPRVDGPVGPGNGGNGGNLPVTPGVDQPSLAVGPGNAPGMGSVWLSWQNANDSISVRGAPVDGLGAVGTYTAIENLPGSAGGNFGSIAVGPNGQVVANYQVGPEVGQSTIYGNLDADGLGPGQFGSRFTITTTNVGRFMPIPAQPNRQIDAEANLAWDQAGKNKGRLYVAYTDAPTTTSTNTNIYVRYSDNNGDTWSDRVKVNDDTGTTTSHFLPSLALDPATGNLAVAWLDTRNDTTGTNRAVQDFVSVSDDGGATFAANARVSSSVPMTAANGNRDFDDYTFVTYAGGNVYPVWPDNSQNLQPANTDLPNFDIAEARVVASRTATATPTLVVSTPLTTARGTPLTVTVMALDALGNVDPNYTGNVGLTSSDPSATLPAANYTFTAADRGRREFSVILRTLGNQTITATSFSRMATSGTISVQTPPATAQTLGMVAGTVFEDLSSDGALNPGDPGLAGQTITLTNLGTNATTTTRTNNTGAYQFTNVASGTYLLSATLAEGDTLSAPGTGQYLVDLPGGDDATNLNFGELIGSSLTPSASPMNFQGPANGLPTPPDDNTLYLQNLYVKVLGRLPDLNGLTIWQAALADGVSRAQVAQAFISSPEHRMNEVDAYYQLFFGRAADQAGRDGWVQAFLNGASEKEVVLGFLTSAEYLQKHPANGSFVMALYEDVLGRLGSAAEVQGWVNALQGGLSRAEAAALFINSRESRTLMARGYYNDFLERAGSAAEVQGWVNILQSSTPGQVQAAFLASPEFQDDTAATASTEEGRGDGG